MPRILTRYNPSIFFVMATPTESNSVININSKVRILIIRFYMMSNKRFTFTTMLTNIAISFKDFVSPLYISPSISPSFIVRGYRLAAFRVLSLLNIFDGSFIGTQLRAEPTFTSKIGKLVEQFITGFAVFSFTLFGHQSEYNKYKGAKQ